jgi:hypothetical protein
MNLMSSTLLTEDAGTHRVSLPDGVAPRVRAS